jgi:hypothetical protein
MMDILVAVVIAPAVAFFVVAVAFGVRNPLRWAAWGAICGPLAVATVMLASYLHTPSVASWYGHDPVVTYTPTNEQPAKPNPFDDLIPAQSYKVPLNEQTHQSQSDPPGLY